MMEIKIQREQEKKVFENELLVSEKIREGLEQTVEQLKESLKEVKMIVQVPRLHFKNIEKLDLENLKGQFDDYEKKKETFMTQTGLDPTPMRSQRLKEQLRAKPIEK